MKTQISMSWSSRNSKKLEMKVRGDAVVVIPGRRNQPSQVKRLQASVYKTLSRKDALALGARLIEFAQKGM